MPRITKDKEERKLELLQAAEYLFNNKGYKNTSVQNIVKEINVAQGTFYYYFNSKEDIFISIIKKYIESFLIKIDTITNDISISPIDKFSIIIKKELGFFKGKNNLIRIIYESENSSIHQKIIVYTIKKMIPFYEKIIKEGNNKEIFNCKYPKDTAELFLLYTKFLFDPYIFELEKNEINEKILFLSYTMDKLLALEGQRFNFSSNKNN